MAMRTRVDGSFLNRLRRCATRFLQVHALPTLVKVRALGRVAMLVTLAATWFASAAQGQPAFVQAAYAVPQTPQATVAVSYSGAQNAGNLNVVIVGWNDASSQVTSVSDTAGNVYTRAVGPTVQPGVQSQAMYYAAGIAGGAGNTVTVSFSRPVSYPDVRIAEYRGIDASQPVAAVKGASGTGVTSNSGSVTTTTAPVLLVAGNYVTTVTTAPGAGFTARFITAPNGSILEDRVVTAPGSYSATARLNSGGWVMQLVAFRGAAQGGSDTQPPTAPTNVTATVAGSTQINLTWTAATDNVGVTEYRIERCQGAGCSAFAQVGTATTTSFSNPGLSPATSYSYRVRAADAAGNLGPNSTTVSAATGAAPDTQPPTAPAIVTATVAGSTQINLTWTAATDNVGVTQYRIERCQGTGCSTFAQVATATTPSFNNPGLSPAASYSYRVRAADAAGNLGSYSTTVSATTNAAADTQPPTTPTNVTATVAGSTQINLTWTAATDNVGVTEYRIERCQSAGCSTFTQVGTATGVSFSNPDLSPATSYSYRVRAADAAGNLGPYSTTVSATTNAAADTQPPTAPTNVAATAVGSTQINLTWTAATDNVGVTEYRIERCQSAGCSTFTQVGTATAPSFSNMGLSPATSYSYRVRAVDAAGISDRIRPSSVRRRARPHR